MSMVSSGEYSRLTVQFGKSTIYAKFFFGDALAIILDGAVPACVIEQDVYLGSPSIKCIFDESTNGVVERDYGGGGLYLINDIVWESSNRHGRVGDMVLLKRSKAEQSKEKKSNGMMQYRKVKCVDHGQDWRQVASAVAQVGMLRLH